MPGTGFHPPERPRSATLVRVEDYYAGRFTAMASPCEVLVDTDDRAEAAALLRLAHQEAERIEHKFSRYRRGNIVDRINQSAGQPVPVDAETAQLIDYAAACWEMGRQSI